jgi:hypothetical protein
MEQAILFAGSRPVDVGTHSRIHHQGTYQIQNDDPNEPWWGWMIRSRVQDTKPDEEKPTDDYERNLPFIHPEIPRANPDGGITCRAF